jgi:thiol-disulfide isomerase/thioredoxin
MAKAKQATSAVQQRDRERARREQQGQRAQNVRNQPRGGRRSKKKSSLSSWIFVGAIIVVVVAIVGGFIWYGNREQTTKTATVSPDIYKSLTSISPTLLSQVGTGGLDSSLSTMIKPVSSTPILKGPTGKPELFYMGAEYCPYCAAQRWSMIVALSRFGSFTKDPKTLISGEDSISTFSFYKSVYQSKYIDFVPVEVEDNAQPTPGQLQNLTSDQTQIVKLYDSPPYTSADSAGSFPFISVGNQFVAAGSYYSPTTIMGQSHQQIIDQIKDPTTDISRGVLGAANYLTAEICALTNNQPANVCSADPIPAIQQTLPQPSAALAHDAGLANADVPQSATMRKRSA